MALNRDGVLLEGIRLANANNVFNFPPRNLVTNPSAFNIITNRAEYVILAGSTNTALKATDIGDPQLRFDWTRNEGSVSRFTYDGFAQKWLPSPGSSPDVLGPLSNAPRLIAPIPDIDVTDAPFKLFLGSSVRVLTFTIQVVGTAGDFTNPSAGIVQLALDTGELNFGTSDISSFGGQEVLSQRQSFFDRIQFKGLIGELPISSSIDYFIHLNPIPSTGQIPRVRIDYRRYLTPVQVPNESGLDGAASGTFRWALDTGRIKFATADIDAFPERSVYYDGVHNSSFQLTRTTLGTLSTGWPSAGFTSVTLIGATDPVRFIIFAESGNIRSYFPARLINNSNLPSNPPIPNECYINTSNGQILFNASDISKFSSFIFHFVDTIATVAQGVSIQFFRSAVNISGVPVVADFTILYFVEDQILADGIGPFPFLQLPTVPVVDNDLDYTVAQGPSSSGTFTGSLKDATDPAESGIGYILNLDQKQLQFSNRKTITKVVGIPTPVLKLDDGIINRFGLQVQKNGTPITPGVDFAFNSTTGEMEFLESVGCNDPNNEFGITGIATLPNLFTPTPPKTFDNSYVGKFVFISDPINAGAYQILGVTSGSLELARDLASSGAVTVDIRTTAEILADNFWQVLVSPLRKISVSRGPSVSGPFSNILGYQVLPTIGQINLSSGAVPGDVFSITYEYLETVGSAQVTTTATEMSLFRVRQEQALSTPGSSTVTFNSAGRDVSLARPFEIYVNGITQPPESFQLQLPDTIFLQQPIVAGQTVMLNYWVNNALGGETSFQLLNSPLVVDSIRIPAEGVSIVLNGDYSSLLTSGSVIISDQTGEVFVASTVVYDSGADTTRVTFESPATRDTGNNGTFRYSASSINPGRASVFEPLSEAISGSSSIRFDGNVIGVATGTILSLNNESYSVSLVKYDEFTNRTTIHIFPPLKRNYFSATVRRSARPIFLPGSSFSTNKPANIRQEFILVLMGNTRKVLERGTDYNVAEGGIIELNFIASGKDSLTCAYVASDLQNVGDEFIINYAYAISPNTANGIAGQRLLSTYNLFSPDCFFYRIETVGTFLPEVQDLLRQSSQSSGVSGPNTRDAVGRTNKDEGSPSPFFTEQHLANLDFSIIQLLKFYNDLTNLYEDLLSDMDGRIVGGEHGRFRFDGITNNPPRDEYSDITNDLDDRIVLYFKKVLTGFFTFDDVPVYVSMSDSNAKSRIYPISNRVSAAINNLVGPNNNGQILGTLGIEDITGAGNFISTPASAFSDRFTHLGSQTSLTIDANGDFDNLVPEFEIGTSATIYSNTGIPNVTGAVVAVGTTFVTITGVSSLETGYIARDTTDPDDTSVSRYKTGLDIGINTETGEIINITNSFSIPNNPQEDINGNEILDVTVQFNNQETTPRRFPALDGSLLNDFGFFSVPRLRREGEKVLYSKEALHLENMGNTSINSPSLNVIFTTIDAVIGDTIRFINGPNAGSQRSITAILVVAAINQYQMSSAFPFADAGSTAEKILKDGTRLNNTLNAEVGILSTNVEGSPIGNLITIDSEIRTVDSIITCLGVELATGSGSPLSTTIFSDPGANFSLDGVDSASFLYISNNANHGLYKVVSATATQIVIEDGPIFVGFPSIAVAGDYLVFNIESFLTTSGPEFLAPFLRETISFLLSTQTWQSSPTNAGKAARTSSLNARSSDVDNFISSVETILQRLDQLYDVRYLWIQQRADKKTGLLTQRNQAILKRQEDLIKIVSDQKKLLITESL